MASGRLRPVSARGMKRELRNAAMGALVSSHFWIMDLEDGYTVQFQNIVNEDRQPIVLTFKNLYKMEVDEKLGPFLEEGKSEGCIGCGISMPWPAVLALIGGTFSSAAKVRHVSNHLMRSRSAAEELGIWQRQFRNLFATAMFEIEFESMCLRDSLINRPRFGQYQVNADPSRSYAISADRAVIKGLPKRARMYLAFCTAVMDETEAGTAEDDSERDYRRAREMNQFLKRADRIEESLLRVIEDNTPHLCLDAVLSKTLAIIDAAELRQSCENEHEALREEISQQWQTSEVAQMRVGDCPLCLKKLREHTARLQEDVAKRLDQLNHLERETMRLWSRSREVWIESDDEG